MAKFLGMIKSPKLALNFLHQIDRYLMSLNVFPSGSLNTKSLFEYASNGLVLKKFLIAIKFNCK